MSPSAVVALAGFALLGGPSLAALSGELCSAGGGACSSQLDSRSKGVELFQQALASSRAYLDVAASSGGVAENDVDASRREATEEEASLGLESQTEQERAKCMREKQVRPSGALTPSSGGHLPTALEVDSLDTIEPLRGDVCASSACGLFDARHPHPRSTRACVREVPKLIHFVWMDHPLPDKYAERIAHVSMANAGWKILLWVNEAAEDTSALSAYLDDTRLQAVDVRPLSSVAGRFRNWDIIQQEPNVGARSDWVRLEVAYLFGGIYMDTDVVKIHSFDQYGSVFRWPFVAYSDPKGPYGNLCNCVFGAEKRSPLLELAMEGWRQGFYHYNIPSGPPFGCGVLTAAFKMHNQPEILMFAQKYMMIPEPHVDPVMAMSFDGSWIKKKKGSLIEEKKKVEQPLGELELFEMQ